ncbi:MAG TPA: nucleotidyltransferase domain-containing protein [Candidatus Nanoarchaeia archaeon]|nr:nucleotidyltransferase domain-containing protein [Candidatus Nanoarchaeia archaeon]
MRSKDVIVIRQLIENRNEELNILKISRGLRMDYKNVYAIIKRLERESLVKLEAFGQSSRVKLISQVHPLIFEAEYQRREDLLKDRNLGVMLNDFKKGLKSKCYTLLVFGSYAKRTQTKNSDIDLMFIVPDGKEEVFEKEAHRIAGSLPLPIHYLVFSEKQFLEMVNTKEPNVGNEALKNNIILHGIEMYYEMI